MKTEVTMTVVTTITSSDSDDYQEKLDSLTEGLAAQGFDVQVEDEDELDYEDVFEMMEEDDSYDY